MAAYHSVPHAEGRDSLDEKHPRISATSDIILSVACLTIPMLIFCAILLGLVFDKQAVQEDLASTTLQDFRSEPGYYYVQYSATRLIFVASLSSTAAPIIGVSILSLWSFPIARHLTRAFEQKALDALPTPFQLSLVLRMLNGGSFGSLWYWLKYLLCWRKTRQAHSHALTGVASATLLAVLLGTLVTLADVWVHISTSTVPFTAFTALSDAAAPNYTYQLTPNCTGGIPVGNSGQLEGSCTLLNSARQGTFLFNAGPGIQALNNFSRDISLSEYGEDNPYVYIGVSPDQQRARTDFTASTYGVRTRCEPITRACHTMDLTVGTAYDCSNGFSGNFFGSDDYNYRGLYFRLETYPNSTMVEDHVLNSTYGYKQFFNPYYTAIAVHTFDPREYAPGYSRVLDPDIVIPSDGGLSWVLACQTTIYDIAYDKVNGSISRFAAESSNHSIPTITANLMHHAWFPYIQPFMTTQALVSGYSSSAREIADQTAVAYSKATLAFLLTALESHKAVYAQERATFLVAKVSQTALWSLIVANLLFVVAGAVLLVVALRSSRADGTDDVQARLSITGLVADRFETHRRDQAVSKIEGLFEESVSRAVKRVAIRPSARGGYTFETI